MKFFVFTFFISFSVFAQADFSWPNQVSKDSGAPTPAIFKLGRNAAVFVGSDHKGGDGDLENRCNGTTISKTGHILTALHCLRDCAVVEAKTYGAVSYLAADQRKISTGSTYCNVYLGYNDNAPGSYRAQVIAAGKGNFPSISPAQLANPQWQQDFAALRAQGYSDLNDYAILRVGRMASKGCMPINRGAAPVGTPVWNFASPGQTYRPHVVNADGERNVFSRGAINSNDGSDITSTIDAVPGSSGSGLFSYEGTLLGITDWISADAQAILAAPQPGSAHSVSIAYILQDAESRFGRSVVDEAFNCY